MSRNPWPMLTTSIMMMHTRMSTASSPPWSACPRAHCVIRSSAYSIPMPTIAIFEPGSIICCLHRECLLGSHPQRPDVLYQHHRMISSSGQKPYTCSCLLNDLTDMNMGCHLPCKRRPDDSSCRR